MPSSTVSRRSLLVAAAAPFAAGQIRLPRKIRVAIIGLQGHTGLIVEPLPQLPDVEIVAICDEDAAALNRFVRGHAALQKARTYADYRRMLDQEKLDVVAVCNDDGHRAAAILACVERKLHVISEKPLATNRKDLESVKSAVAKQGVKLGMLLDMRYTPPYRGLREIVKAGKIGEVAQMSAQKSYIAGKREAWYKSRDTYGSTILWIGIHMIDLMRFTTGRDFKQASSFMGHVGFPELGSMETTTASAFRLDNGGTAVLHMDYYRPESAPTHGDDRLRLAGTEGVAEYSEAGGVTLLSKGSKLTVIDKLPVAGSVFVDFLENAYMNQPASLSLEDIYRACEITIGANEAALTGRVVSVA